MTAPEYAALLPGYGSSSGYGRVGPMKTNDNATLAVFDIFFARPDLVWVEITKDVVELAAALSGGWGPECKGVDVNLSAVWRRSLYTTPANRLS